jgi:hypothetical protein
MVSLERQDHTHSSVDIASTQCIACWTPTRLDDNMIGEAAGLLVVMEGE